MHRGTHALLAAVIIVSSQAGDASCNVTPWACDTDTRGIRVQNGVVTDEIRVACDPPPRTHRLDGWIEYRADFGQNWRRAGEVATTRERPEPTVELPVSAWDCVPGDYRAAWQVTGISGNEAETPFNRRDGDFAGTPVTAEDCAGGR